MDISEVAGAIVADPRFNDFSVSEQLQIRRDLFSQIENDSYSFARLPFTAKQEVKKRFITEVPNLAIANLRQQVIDAGPNADPQQQYALHIYDRAIDAKAMGESSLNFADGVMDKTATTFGMMGRIATKLASAWTGTDLTETVVTGPDVSQAREYLNTVDSFTPSSKGKFDYNLGKNLIAGLNGTAELAMMAAAYGTFSLTEPTAAGFLTGWIPKIASASTKTGRAATMLGWGLQAATESIGYVGEELLIDMLSGRFKDDEDAWNNWASEIPGDMGKGLFFFGLGEAMGGLLSKSIKASAKGVTGLSMNQHLNYLKKLDNGEILEQFKKTAVFGDDAAWKTLQETVRGVGGEDAIVTLDRARRRVQTARKFGNAVMDPDEATKGMLEMEFDATFKGNKLTSFQGKPVDVTFKDMPDLIKKLNAEEFKVADIRSAKVAAAKGQKLSLTAQIDGDFVKSRASARNIVKTFIGTDGATSPAKTKAFLDTFGKKARVSAVAEIDPAGFKKGRFFIPENLDTKAKLKEYLPHFDTQLKLNGIDVKQTYEISDYVEAIRLGRQWDEAGVRALPNIKDLTMVENGIYTASVGKAGKFTGTLEEVGEYGHFRASGLKEMNARLFNDFGLKIKKGDTAYLLQDGNRVLGRYKSLKNLWESNKELMPKRAADSAPVWYRSGGNGITYETNLATGSIDDLKKSVDKFENNWETRVSQDRTFTSKSKGGHSVTVEPKNRLYKVTLGDSRLTKTFGTSEDLKAFLGKDMKTFDNLSEQFLNEFTLELRALPTGGYQIFGEALDNPRYFKRLSQVRKYIGEMTESGGKLKNISGLSDIDELGIRKVAEEGFKEYQNQVSKFAQRSTDKIRSGKGVEHFMTNHIRSTQRLVELVNVPEISKGYQNSLARGQLFRKSYMEASNLARTELKGFTKKEILAMGQIMMHEGDAGDWRKIAIANGIPVDSRQWDDMVSTMNKFRGLFDDYGRNFGIDLNMWKKDYLPRIKNIEFAAIRADKIMEKDYIRTLLQGDKPLPNTDPFFEHVRTEDLYTAKLEGDLESIFDIYIRIGMRKQYLGDSLQQFDKAVKASKKAGDITGETYRRLEVYGRASQGMFIDEKAASQYVNKMERNHRVVNSWLKKKGLGAIATNLKDFSPAQVRRYEHLLNADISRGLSTLQTSALMSFKMWMPMRNVSQVNHVGALYGNVNVIRAQEALLKDPSGWWKKANDMGLLQARGLPNERNFLSFLEKVNRRGTNWFKNSDDYTRIIAMMTTGQVFDESLARLAKGGIDIEKFMKITQGGALDDGAQELMIESLKRGDSAAAKNLLSRNVVQWTMFDYSAAQKPSGLQHNMGRALLSYSTYPQQFSEMLGRMLKNDPLAGVRLVGNMAALGFLYTDVLGVKGYEGNPLNVMLFMGGPLMTGGLDILGAASSISDIAGRGDIGLAEKGSRIGQTASGVGEGISRVLVPFNWYPRRFGQAVASLDNGEFYASALQFAGVNVNNEGFLNNLDPKAMLSLMNADRP